jgi:hypothetical protein
MSMVYRMKVDTCLIQKNRKTVYGTLTEDDLLEEKVAALMLS